MEITQIKEGLPIEVTSQLMSNEKVFYFSYIAFQGGCGSSGEKERYWLALTDKRVMYYTKVIESSNNKEITIERSGDLPFSKISFIEVSEYKKTSFYELRISSSGGTIHIPIPTKEKGYEIRRIYSELNQ